MNHWRWVLTDANGTFVADHSVALNPSETKYQALFKLRAFLWEFAAPDRRETEERRLMENLGAWIGDVVLGKSIGDKIIAHSAPPIIVRVRVPPVAERVLFMPLETAHARGKPLAVQGVSLVFEVVDEAPLWSAIPISDRHRLRLLALFSLPPEGVPLNLRRERQMLRSLVRRLTGAIGLSIDLRVLQYGVTRESLRDALAEGEGWDVIHFSGHGLPGTLLLEKPDGRPDPFDDDRTLIGPLPRSVNLGWRGRQVDASALPS